MDNSGRHLLYGKTVFTTMRMSSGSIKDWDSHFERLTRGIDFISGPLTPPILKDLKQKLEAKLAEFNGNQVLRLDINWQNLSFEVSPRELPLERSAPFKLRGLKHRGRGPLWPSFLKSEINFELRNSHLQAGDDDLLFLSDRGILEESSIANIFIIKDQTLYTPKLGPNVLDGIVRRKVINNAARFFLNVCEEDILFDHNFTADAIFLTNSVRGAFLVDRIDQFEITYTSDLLKKFDDIKELVMK